jgi:hypothetical protein
MIKKLLPLLTLSLPTSASLIPFDFKIEKQLDSTLVEILLQDISEDINITQLYLSGLKDSFKDIDFSNPFNENYKIFSSSMRIYDSNSDDLISFGLNFKYLAITSFEYGIGYYNDLGYQYNRGTIEVSEKNTQTISEPTSLLLLGLGVYGLYRSRKKI